MPRFLASLADLPDALSNALPRRRFLQATGVALGSLAGACGVEMQSPSAFGWEGKIPQENPTARFDQPWTDSLPWERTVSIADSPGKTWDDRLAAAQGELAAIGGGVVYFPPGVYPFADSIRLKNGVILRGAPPAAGLSGIDPKYSLASRIEFPRYVPKNEGAGTPIDSAFRGISLEKPAEGAGCGVVHLAIERGHIHFSEDESHRCGPSRLIVGCILTNAAVADPAVPNAKLGQHPWQRFTARHRAAIEAVAEKNLLIAGNRLPPSGQANFTMPGFLVKGRNGPEPVDVVFDYDNRPGIYANHYCIGGPGGSGEDGTPEKFPWGFRTGLVIRENYIFNTGRMGIGFSGDGVICSGNVIRIAKDVWRPTVTGQALTFGSSTNDNRAIEMRGWRWTVEGNDYEVHRNWAADRKYLINDGEGLMHEDHCNSTIRDSRLVNNRGNAYLSIYKCGEIDGLLVEGNEISVSQGAAIYVVSNRNSGPAPIRNVTIRKNRTSGGGIRVAGSPSKNVLIEGNRHSGSGGTIENEAAAKIADNHGYLSP